MLFLAGISFLVFLANAFPTVEPPSVSTDYDAIIVGGGPSGLAALSALARIRRRALLIDSAEYRNSPTRLMHDVVGFDGVRPAYYRWVARQQIAHYSTVNATNGTVTKIEPAADYSSFNVSMTSFDGTLLSYTALKIILATGVRDILPQTPGIQENFGKGIYWCPWCDGHEHADQPLGLLGPLDKAIEAMPEIVTLNSDVVLFVNGTDTPAARARADTLFAEHSSAYLQWRHIRVDNRTITRVVRLRDGVTPDADPRLPSVPEYDLFRVELEAAPSVERAVLFQLVESEQRSALGEMVGVEMVGGMMAVDSEMRTNVPGVWAIGDANTDKSTNVLHSAYTGKIAGVDLHMQIERDASRALKPVAQDGKRREEERLWAKIKVITGNSFDTVQHILN